MSTNQAEAFVSKSIVKNNCTGLNCEISSRRSWLTKSIAIATSGAIGTAAKPANASYSAFAAREKDWEQRKNTGEIKYSSTKELRDQLREIAPMNSEGSKIFCPNGASSAVSPLMENKCSDLRAAIPSVYGRSEDITGNSIPGFRGGYYDSGINSSTSVQTLGGFPEYSKTPKR